MSEQGAALVRSGTSLSIGVTEKRGVSLCEVLDRVLDTGVVGHGDVVISVANVDLVYLSLRLLLSSVETARKAGASVPVMNRSSPEPAEARSSPRARHHPATLLLPSSPLPLPPPPPVGPVVDAATPFRPEVLPREDTVPAPPTRLNVPQDDVRNGLAQLVMVLVKLLHELLERQAVKRIDGGFLSDDEVDRLGTTLMRQAEEIRRLQKTFGLSDADMNLDLGPLGKLL